MDEKLGLFSKPYPFKNIFFHIKVNPEKHSKSCPWKLGMEWVREEEWLFIAYLLNTKPCVLHQFLFVI